MFKRKRIHSKPPNRNMNRHTARNPLKRKRTDSLPSRTMGVNEERDTTETIPDNVVKKKRIDGFPPGPITTNMDVEPTEARPAIESLTNQEQNENQDIKEKLILARELMDSARKEIEIDCLQTAISSLQDILDSGRERYVEEDRARIAHYLVKALLIRYGIYRWIEDLDTCVDHFNNALKSGSDVMFEVQEGDESIVEIQPAIQLIQACRNSLDHDNLNTVISIATQALPSNGSDNPNLQYADLLILLGNALVIKYLINNDVAKLEEASLRFQELWRIATGHMALNYISWLSLGYVELLRVIEGGDIDGLFQFVEFLKMMWAADKAGEELALNGEKMTEHTVDDARLNEGIAFLNKSLHLRTAPHPRRVFSLYNLGRAHLARFDRQGDLRDLMESIGLFREALDLRPAPHPNRADSLNSLAVSLSERFEHQGLFDDLEEHILLLREALNLLPTSNPDYSVLLNNLATALCTRFKQRGAFEDLEHCIACHEEALSLRPAPHPDRPSSLNNLAIALSTRFGQKGTLTDLEECILLHREALNLFSEPERSISLGNLATALSTRFEQRGTFEDLQECIMLLREAVNLQPIPHPDRFGSLKNLGTAMLRRFERTGTLNDLEEGITLFREALNLRQAPYPDYSVLLNNLANALCTRFGEMEAFEDFKESITLYQEVLKLQPAPHPMRCESLSNLAAALLTYFKHKEAFQDHDPFLQSFFGDLASSLDTKFENYQDDPIIETALHCCEEASKYETGSLLRRLGIARTWAICAQDHRPSVALDAYRYAMTLLPLLASLDLTLQQRQDVLTHTQALAQDAAKSAITANQCDVAVVFLSSGRSIFWSQALQLRTSVNELAKVHPAHAEKLITLSMELEHASYSSNEAGTMLSTITSQDPGAYRSLYSLAAQHHQIIEEIRELPKFEGFLRPPSLASIQHAANNGPIVLLNASELGCDALVIVETGVIKHVPLPDINMEDLEELREPMRLLLQAELRTIDVSHDTIDLLQTFLGRDMVLEDPTTSSANEDPFRLARLALEGLWVKVVMPVVVSLGLKKSDSTKRIWWCPTGPFSYLPIHAAGIYSQDNEPIDCIFQYIVSSYCTSPQDLLHSQPQITKDFKMTAIIEPEAPSAVNLPATRKELKVIENHIPNPSRHITRHIGTRDSPTSIDGILSDIQESSFTHFGCHGMQNLKNPLESYLLLSGGRLTMEKIIKECQVPEGALAYLSACETAKGDEARPDESLNLVATMMFAGFRSVVGTMWSILDEDAPIVADVFYGHLFRNGGDTLPDVRDAACGLHLATKELRERGRPFSSWVPYVHYGI